MSRPDFIKTSLKPKDAWYNFLEEKKKEKNSFITVMLAGFQDKENWC